MLDLIGLCVAATLLLVRLQVRDARLAIPAGVLVTALGTAVLLPLAAIVSGVPAPGAAVAMAALSVWALVSLARARPATGPSLWLAAALYVSCLAWALLALGSPRLTVPSQVAHMLGAASSLTVTAAVLTELLGTVRRAATQQTELAQLLHTDVLTGLANRRAFDTALESECRRAQRDEVALSLVLIDIDHFKGFNDRYGHPSGDACLRVVARSLARQAFRGADLAARIGGEEFAILLPATEEAGALQVAERLRRGVSSLALSHAGSDTGFLTISVGVATIRPGLPGASSTALVSEADSALYSAKNAGRDRVCVAGPPVPTIDLQKLLNRPASATSA